MSKKISLQNLVNPRVSISCFPCRTPCSPRQPSPYKSQLHARLWEEPLSNVETQVNTPEVSPSQKILGEDWRGVWQCRQAERILSFLFSWEMLFFFLVMGPFKVDAVKFDINSFKVNKTILHQFCFSFSMSDTLTLNYTFVKIGVFETQA